MKNKFRSKGFTPLEISGHCPPIFKDKKDGKCYAGFTSDLRKRFKKRFLSLTGFTLVELLLVITILGILAAIAIPRLFPQTEKARVAEAINILSAIRQAQEAYFLQHGKYCEEAQDGCTWDDLGMGDPDLDATYFSYNFNNSKELDETGGFLAVATRTSARASIPGGGTYRGNTIALDNAGNFNCSTSYAAFCPSG